MLIKILLLLLLLFVAWFIYQRVVVNIMFKRHYKKQGVKFSSGLSCFKDPLTLKACMDADPT
jgi:hypothetical protein